MRERLRLETRTTPPLPAGASVKTKRAERPSAGQTDSTTSLPTEHTLAGRQPLGAIHERRLRTGIDEPQIAVRVGRELCCL